MQILPPLTAVLRGGFSFGEVSVLSKPPNIANDEFKSAKWDELTAGRAFAQSDAPALACCSTAATWTSTSARRS